MELTNSVIVYDILSFYIWPFLYIYYRFCRKTWTQEIWWWSTGQLKNWYENICLNCAFATVLSSSKKMSQNWILSIRIFNITLAEYLILWAIWTGKYYVVIVQRERLNFPAGNSWIFQTLVSMAVTKSSELSSLSIVKT